MHHSVSILQIEEESNSKRLLKLRFLKSNHPSPAGSLQELEQKMDYLSIIFMDQNGMFELATHHDYILFENAY